MNATRAATAWLATGFLLLVGVGRVPLGAAPAATAPSKKVTAAAGKKKAAAPGKAKAVRSAGKGKAAAASKRTVGRRGGRRSASDHYTVIGQQRPAPERVIEIERALAQRGLLIAEPDGTWDDSTTDALRRFQQQTNLRADGKLSAHSLVALGLGPRRGGPPPAVNPQPPPPPSPPSEAKDQQQK